MIWSLATIVVGPVQVFPLRLHIRRFCFHICHGRCPPDEFLQDEFPRLSFVRPTSDPVQSGGKAVSGSVDIGADCPFK